MRIKGILTVALTAVLLGASGCAYRLDRFQPSFKNIETLRNLSVAPRPINLAPFTSTALWSHNMVCRKHKDVALPWRWDFEEYLREAMQRELDMANLYDPAAATALSANVDKVDFETDVQVRSVISGMKGGRWIIQMTFQSNTGRRFTVSDSFGFKTHYKETWTDDETCHTLAKAFLPAVQQFLNKVYRDPNFMLLLGIRSANAPVKLSPEQQAIKEQEKRFEELLRPQKAPPINDPDNPFYKK